MRVEGLGSETINDADEDGLGDARYRCTDTYLCDRGTEREERAVTLRERQRARERDEARERIKARQGDTD